MAKTDEWIKLAKRLAGCLTGMLQIGAVKNPN
jgi:hypothetical protein